MKEIQTPRKNLPRYSDPGSRRVKDSQLKNRKVEEKRLSAPFSDLSSETTKDPVGSAPIRENSGYISDCDAESVVQGSSLDLLSLPEKFSLTDLSPVSTITAEESHLDVSAAIHSLRAEVNALKNLILPSDVLEERSRINETIMAKYRIVFLFFLLLAILVLIMVFFSLEEQVSYIGPLPT